jgi:hypothetical protein
MVEYVSNNDLITLGWIHVNQQTLKSLDFNSSFSLDTSNSDSIFIKC